MSERSTERLPPMDSRRGPSTPPSGANTNQATQERRRGKEADGPPDQAPSYDAQEQERRETVHGDARQVEANARLAPDPAELDAARTLARAHLDTVNDAMVDLAIAHGDWLLDNLNVYLGGSGGGGPVQFESVAVERLATTAWRRPPSAASSRRGGGPSAGSSRPPRRGPWRSPGVASSCPRSAGSPP